MNNNIKFYIFYTLIYKERKKEIDRERERESR